MEEVTIQLQEGSPKFVGTVAMNIEWMRIDFLGDVFAAVAFLGS